MVLCGLIPLRKEEMMERRHLTRYTMDLMIPLKRRLYRLLS
nr:MAG TPA: hypothetical protein [Caudoviricetes sp.]